MAARRPRVWRSSGVLLSAVALIALCVGPARVAGAGAAGPQMIAAGELTSGETHNEIIVLFDEQLDERVIPTPGDFTIAVDDGTPFNAVAASYLFSGLVMDSLPTGVTFLRLDLPAGVTVGPSTAKVSVSYLPTSAPLRDLALTEAAASTFTAGGVAVATGSFSLVAAVIDGLYGANHLAFLVFGQVDLGSIPGTDDFAVTINGAPVTVNSVTAPPVFNDIGMGVLDLALATSALPGDVAHVHYKPGANPIKSRSDPTVSLSETDADVSVLIQKNTAAATFATGGGTLSTADGTEPTAADPVATTVTTPSSGDVSISEGPVDPGLTGYAFFGQQVTIHAPAATDPTMPLVLQFAIDASLVPQGQTAETVVVLRNGVAVPPCATLGAGVADPSPCVDQREALTSGDIVITVDTLEASVWNMAAGNPPPPPPPSVSVPPDIATVATGPAGAVVSYDAHATDAFGAAIPPGCSASSGSMFPVGTTTVSCTATDALGQHSSTRTFRVTVGYGFAGFFQPLNDPIAATDPKSVFKVGSTIPVKFALTYADGTTRISDTAASAIASACGATISFSQTGSSVPSINETPTSTTPNAGGCFRYDAGAHQFLYSFGTNGWAPGSYMLGASVRLGDSILAAHSLAVGLR